MKKRSVLIRVARSLILLVAIIGAAIYGIDQWQERSLVASQIEDAEFQHTHYGKGPAVFCGEVSGINGFGTRTPYTRFVLDGARLTVAPLSFHQQEIEAFETLWKTQCAQ
jgi:hypothetical protein